jgi:NADPH:quinone reductase-like Zn-dependent oxidoreductase
MKAYLVSKYRSPMKAGEVAEPAVGDRDVLVDVHAAGLNLLDAKIRDGEFKLIVPYKAPFILGHDLAGVVTRVGSAVARFTVGDEVYARPRDGRIGTFAERIAVDEDDLAIKPTSLSMAEAASVPLVALTAWQALVERANLQPGHKVLIHGGSGGVGTYAIQLAKHLGCGAPPRHHDVTVTIAAREIDPASLIIEPIADPAARLLGPEPAEP